MKPGLKVITRGSMPDGTDIQLEHWVRRTEPEKSKLELIRFAKNPWNRSGQRTKHSDCHFAGSRRRLWKFCIWNYYAELRH